MAPPMTLKVILPMALISTVNAREGTCRSVCMHTLFMSAKIFFSSEGRAAVLECASSSSVSKSVSSVLVSACTMKISIHRHADRARASDEKVCEQLGQCRVGSRGSGSSRHRKPSSSPACSASCDPDGKPDIGLAQVVYRQEDDRLVTGVKATPNEVDVGESSETGLAFMSSPLICQSPWVPAHQRQ